jgi:hypothetical protein
MVETALAHVLLVALQCPRSERSFAVFDNIVNFRDRLSVVNAVVQSALGNDPLSDEWSRIYIKLGRLAKKRNWIAHAGALEVLGPSGSQLYASPPLSKLPVGSLLKESDRKKMLRDARQLATLAKAFVLAANRIFSFLDKARVKLARPPK